MKFGIQNLILLALFNGCQEKLEIDLNKLKIKSAKNHY